ncbi:MAG: cell division protein ZapE, partial [Rickettsiales bacterium]
MNSRTKNKQIILDPAQKDVQKHLNHLAKQVTKNARKNQARLALKAWFVDADPVKSLYIYGKVGRGKSMLMQGFFKDLDLPEKVYFHFNNLMQEIHKELHILRKIPANKNRDLIADATSKVIGSSRVLCFDEMQVEDVADAMILQGMFKYFSQNDIAVVTTSNCHPLELYENGLQRNLFLQFVNEILLQKFLVLDLDGEIDYRGEKESIKKHYFYPNNPENTAEILKIWDGLLENNKPHSQEIAVLGRKIVAKKTYQKMAMFDFSELCLADLGTADFGAIAKTFSRIFLLNVPILKPEDRGPAKRLIWFVDEAYENNVELVVLSQVRPEEIYVSG